MRMGNDIKSEYLPNKISKVYYESFMSGLANRMRAWVTTSAFAEYLNVSYTMSWRPDDACGKKHFTDLFEVPDNMNLVEHKKFEIDKKTLWIRKNYPNNKFHDVIIENNFDLSKKEIQKFVNNQRQNIILLPNIEQKFKEYTETLNIKNSIGLHIRRTDLKEQDKTPDTWFDQSIQSELKQNSDARFFLATDNKWTEEKFMTKYEDVMVKTEREFDDVDGGEIYPGGHRKRHSPTEQGLIDMLLLSYTQKVYGCHGSSFGRFGAWYGNKPFILPEIEK